MSSLGDIYQWIDRIPILRSQGGCLIRKIAMVGALQPNRIGMPPAMK